MLMTANHVKKPRGSGYCVFDSGNSLPVGHLQLLAWKKSYSFSALSEDVAIKMNSEAEDAKPASRPRT